MVAQRAETTVTERSLMSCVWACFLTQIPTLCLDSGIAFWRKKCQSWVYKLEPSSHAIWAWNQKGCWPEDLVFVLATESILSLLDLRELEGTLILKKQSNTIAQQCIKFLAFHRRGDSTKLLSMNSPVCHCQYYHWAWHMNPLKTTKQFCRNNERGSTFYLDSNTNKWIMKEVASLSRLKFQQNHFVWWWWLIQSPCRWGLLEGWRSVLTCLLVAVESDSWCIDPIALWTGKGLGWGWLGCYLFFLPPVFILYGYMPVCLELGVSSWWAQTVSVQGLLLPWLMADSCLCQLSVNLVFLMLSLSIMTMLSFFELTEEDCFGHAHVFHSRDMASPAQVHLKEDGLCWAD